MYCPNCGNRLDNNANYCSNCGYQIVEKQSNIKYVDAPSKIGIILSYMVGIVYFLWSIGVIFRLPLPSFILFILIIKPHFLFIAITIYTLGFIRAKKIFDFDQNIGKPLIIIYMITTVLFIISIILLFIRIGDVLSVIGRGLSGH